MTTLTESEFAIADRSLWRRVTRYQVVRLVIAICIIGLSFFIAQKLLRLEVVKWLHRDLKYALMSCMVVLSYIGYVKWIERRELTELGLRPGIRDLMAGFLTGAILFATIVGVIAVAGGYQIIGWNSVAVLGPSLFMFFFVAVFEELVSRAVLFRIIEASLGSWLALFISAGLFGMAHISNPNASWFSSLAIAIEAGILLGAAFMLTRNLGFCIGIHWAWNFVQGGVFSIAVSGEKSEGWIRSTNIGPIWLTGGEFGAEASLVALVMATSTGIALLLLAYRRGQWLRPFWRTTPA